jgi:hypothetical protein
MKFHRFVLKNRKNALIANTGILNMILTDSQKPIFSKEWISMQDKQYMLHDEPMVSYYKHHHNLYAAYHHAKKVYKILKHLVHHKHYHHRHRKWDSSSSSGYYESSHWY